MTEQTPDTGNHWQGNIRFVLISTTFINTVVATAGYLIPALATATRETLGVDAAFFGFQVTLAFGSGGVSAMIGGGIVGRFGPCRVSQFALALIAIGCALYAIPQTSILTAGSIVIGLGYGLANPAASVLLTRFGHPSRLNFLFSFRQASTALGAVCAGMLGPAIAIVWGWQWAFHSLAILSLGVALSINGLRGSWDDGANLRTPLSTPWEGFRIVIRNKSLLWLCIAGIGFSSVQMGLFAFLVLFLVEDVGFTLAAGGMVLSLINFLGAGSRILWGWRADQAGNSLLVVAIMGVATAIIAALAAFATPDWPQWLVFGIFSAFGLAAFGWSGIVMANVAMRAEPDKIAETVGAGLGFLFSGAWIGPSIGSLILHVTGSYRYVFLFLTGAALVATVLAVKASRYK